MDDKILDALPANAEFANQFTNRAAPPSGQPIESCTSCKFHMHAGIKDHFCRRYPPHVIMMGPQGPLSTFAPIQPTMWCGEYERKAP